MEDKLKQLRHAREGIDAMFEGVHTDVEVIHRIMNRRGITREDIEAYVHLLIDLAQQS